MLTNFQAFKLRPHSSYPCLLDVHPGEDERDNWDATYPNGSTQSSEAHHGSWCAMDGSRATYEMDTKPLWADDDASTKPINCARRCYTDTYSTIITWRSYTPIVHSAMNSITKLEVLSVRHSIGKDCCCVHNLLSHCELTNANLKYVLWEAISVYVCICW